MFRYNFHVIVVSKFPPPMIFSQYLFSFCICFPWCLSLSMPIVNSTKSECEHVSLDSFGQSLSLDEGAGGYACTMLVKGVFI